MKKFFKFIFIFGLTAFIMLLFIKPTVAEAYSFNEDVNEQMNLNNNDSLVSVQATTNPLYPSSVKITGKDKFGEEGTVIYTPDQLTEPGNPPTGPATNNYYIFNDVPYKVRAYILEVEFANRDLISSVEASQNGTKITTQNIFEDGSVELLMSDDTLAKTDTIQLTITPKTGSKAYCFINVNRLAADSNNYLKKVTVVAHNGEESVEIDSTTTESMSSSGRVNFIYPNEESTLPFRFKDFSIEATPESDLSTVEIKINNIVRDSYEFSKSSTTSEEVSISIKVVPEAGITRTYTATFRKAAPDMSHEFEIVDASYTYIAPDGTEQSDSFELKIVTLEETNTEGETVVKSIFISNPDSLLPFTATSASFKIVPTSPTTKVYIDGDDYTNTLFTTSIENTKSSLTKRVLLLLKSEYDELTRPGNTTSGGLTYNIDLSSSKPDSKRKLTGIQILNAVSGDVESNDENTVSSEFAYSFELKKSILGEVFKLDLLWESGYTKAYLSTTNSSSIMIDDNLYDPNTVWNIGTDIYLYLQSQDGEHVVYAISTSFADERSTENGVEDVVLSYGSTNIDFTFDEDQQTYPATGSFKVPFSVVSIQAVITLKHEMETLQSGENYITGALNSDLKVIQTISLEEGVNTFKLKAISEKETEGKEYTFVIEREAGQEDNELGNLVINGIDCTDISQVGSHFDYVFDSEAQQFSFYAPRGTNSFNLDFDIPSEATYTINTITRSSSTLPYTFIVNDGEMAEISVNVKSEVETIRGEGEGKTYNIKVYVADQVHRLDDLHIYVSKEDLTDVLDMNGDPLYFDGNPNMGTIVFPFKVKSVYFLPEANDFLGKIKFGSETLDSLSHGFVKELNVGNNLIEFYILS
ncbi:MAG: hypothetical protein K2N42_03645 [Anaeroplasmataceae bacterium]|nr:hypothetical protein [Anaeroplasmataceae bacterium]